MKLEVPAYAKINWSLNVTARRADGYHELDGLMQSVELADALTIEDAPTLSLCVDGQAAPADDTNLVLRAARALIAHSGRRMGARMTLQKRIPARAGLGGGSADCAAALLALNRLWKLELDAEALLRLGAQLGADVPFCLHGGLCRARGVGERLEAYPSAPVYWLALCTPGGGLSTPAVFQVWDAAGAGPLEFDADRMAEALMRGDLTAAQKWSANALEAPAVALMPEIGRTIDAFRALGAPFVRMTGSGSTVVAAFPDEAPAREAAARIPGAICTRTRAD